MTDVQLCGVCCEEISEEESVDGMCSQCKEDLRETVVWLIGMLSEEERRFLKNHPEILEEVMDE